MLEPLHHFQLTVVVAPVQNNLFNGNRHISTLLTRTPHDTKGAVADDLFHAVSAAAAFPQLAILRDLWCRVRHDSDVRVLLQPRCCWLPRLLARDAARCAGGFM